MAFTELLEQFNHFLRVEKRYSEHTLVSYTNDLSTFFDYIAKQYDCEQIAEVSPVLIRSFLANQISEGAKTKTLNRRLSAIKSYI